MNNSESVRPVLASNFVGTIAANVDNGKISDAEFRKFIRRTLPIVQYDAGRFPLYESRKRRKPVRASAFNSLDLMAAMHRENAGA
jgi:hypothetical protein